MALLAEMKDELLKIGLEEASLYFRDKRIDESFNFGGVLKRYQQIKVTNRRIVELSSEFCFKKTQEKVYVSR